MELLYIYEAGHLYIQSQSKVIMKLNLTIPMNVVIFLRVQTKVEPLIFCIYCIWMEKRKVFSAVFIILSDDIV